MKLKALLFLALMSVAAAGQAQDKKEGEKKEAVHIYNPNANAQADLNAAISKAKKEKKNVLVQVGGNWCIWCIRFHELVDKTPELKKLIGDNFEWVLVNWSRVYKKCAVKQAGQSGPLWLPCIRCPRRRRKSSSHPGLWLPGKRRRREQNRR
jgi:thioredoxin-related protein